MSRLLPLLAISIIWDRSGLAWGRRPLMYWQAEGSVNTRDSKRSCSGIPSCSSQCHPMSPMCIGAVVSCCLVLRVCLHLNWQP